MDKEIEKELQDLNAVRDWMSDEEFTGYLIGELIGAWDNNKHLKNMLNAQNRQKKYADWVKRESEEPKKETAPDPVPPEQEDKEPKKVGRRPSWNVQKASTMWAAGWEEHKIVEALQKDGDHITLQNFRNYRALHTNLFPVSEEGEDRPKE